MNQFFEISNAASTLLIDRSATFLWQSTVLVLLVALAAMLLRRASPAVRFWLWQIVALKLLLLPFWLVDVPLPARFASKPPPTVTNTAIELPSPAPTPTDAPTKTSAPSLAISPPQTANPSSLGPQIKWQTGLLAVWLTVVAYQIARVLAQRKSLRRLLHQAQPAKNQEALVVECAAALGLPRPPTTQQIDADVSPFVCGVWQPILVLPKSLVDSATPTRLRQIVLHELAHIRRRDLLWCWIPTVMQLVYWFHPAAHWVAYRIKLERELACDQLAIQHSNSSASDYADTLVDVVSHNAARIAAHAALSAQFAGGTKR
ncbi:MAG: M56 family metallopeptidase [Planctomycetes bacterium]|nr:M56 family metallopeptidase [Planctomycetota bacterium]